MSFLLSICIINHTLYLLRFPFVCSLTLVIYSAEVGYDDRNRKCYDEYTAEGTHTADDFADHCVRYHVAVAASKQQHQAWAIDWSINNLTLVCLAIGLLCAKINHRWSERERERERGRSQRSSQLSSLRWLNRLAQCNKLGNYRWIVHGNILRVDWNCRTWSWWTK